MISRKGNAGKPIGSAVGGPSSPKGKGAFGGPTVDHLGKGVADLKLGASGEDKWEVQARKLQHRRQNNPSGSWDSQSSGGKAWKDPDVIQKLGMRNSSHSMSNVWGAQTPNSSSSIGDSSSTIIPASNPDSADELDETDDDDFSSDEYDSDCNQMSHEKQKSIKWFKAFFDTLDKLTVDVIADPTRQWHCPACSGGPGAIDWYKGLQPLISHANTKGANRIKRHRLFAKVLNEELHIREVSVVPAGEAFGKWKGLSESTAKDLAIVWPPMVIIMNTKLEQNENDKWIGMGNQELLDYFSAYPAIGARHSYGPQGHRGMSVLIFEASAPGYFEAERLHKHFQEQRTDRNAWDRHPVIFYPGGERQLYGYMAVKDDMEIFNQHCTGKSRLKYEMRSYNEMVVAQIKQMSEDNQQLGFYKDRVDREQRRTKALQESFGLVSEKLRKTMEENRIVRRRTKLQHEQNKEELQYQEEFFKDQIKIIHEARDAKENEFEKLQQEEREKVKQATANPSTVDGRIHRSEEVAKFIELQDKEMEDYVAERERLMKENEETKMGLKKQYMDEVLKLEKQLDAQLADLMKKYTSPPPLTEEDKSG